MRCIVVAGTGASAPGVGATVTRRGDCAAMSPVDQDLHNRVVLGSAMENGIRRPPASAEFYKGAGRRDSNRHVKVEPTRASERRSWL